MRSTSPDGPLPVLLLVLTGVTGLVDAVAYLKLGHVFVANMTGNVVFLGFAAAGTGGLSIGGSLVANACFRSRGRARGRPPRPPRGQPLPPPPAPTAGEDGPCPGAAA